MVLFESENKGADHLKFIRLYSRDIRSVLHMLVYVIQIHVLTVCLFSNDVYMSSRVVHIDLIHVIQMFI